VKLAELNPTFLGSGGEGVYTTDPTTGQNVPAPKRVGVGVQCDCPCGCESPLSVPFKVALDGQPTPHGERGWDREGDTFETLTLSPSILRPKPPGCGWHGWIKNGEVIPC
jgi:hypothetical protein